MECSLPSKRPWRTWDHDLQVKNRALLGKWLFKLLSEEGYGKQFSKEIM
jgi:hypothetical protein